MTFNKIFLIIVLILNVISLSIERTFLRRQNDWPMQKTLYKAKSPRRVTRTISFFNMDPVKVEARGRIVQKMLKDAGKLFHLNTEPEEAPATRPAYHRRRAVTKEQPKSSLITTESSNVFSKNFVQKLVHTKLKVINMGSIAAGVLGLMWPGPLGPIVSALLAPVIYDMVSTKNS